MCLRPIDSKDIKRRHPHLLSLTKDEKLGFYAVPTRNGTPRRRVAVINTNAEPRQLHSTVKGLFRLDASAGIWLRKTQRAGFGTHDSKSEHSRRTRRVIIFMQ